MCITTGCQCLLGGARANLADRAIVLELSDGGTLPMRRLRLLRLQHSDSFQGWMRIDVPSPAIRGRSGLSARARRQQRPRGESTADDAR